MPLWLLSLKERPTQISHSFSDQVLRKKRAENDRIFSRAGTFFFFRMFSYVAHTRHTRPTGQRRRINIGPYESDATKATTVYVTYFARIFFFNIEIKCALSSEQWALVDSHHSTAHAGTGESWGDEKKTTTKIYAKIGKRWRRANKIWPIAYISRPRSAHSVR